MSITIVNTLPEIEWRCFVDNHPDGNIFHTPEMFQVFSRTKNYRPELWAATNETRILALFLPVHVTLMNGLLRHFTTRSIAYGSVLCEYSSEGKEALYLLLQTYIHEVDKGVLFTQLRNVSNLEVIQSILYKHSFIFEDYLNYLIDLKPNTDAILQNIGRRTRKHIRRGLRLGDVVVEEVRDCRKISLCYDTLRKSYRAAQLPLADISLFEAAFDILHPKRMIVFTLSLVAQKCAAVSIELLYKDVIYGWYGGVDRTCSSFMPNELLMWHILEWGGKRGYSYYDFGGAGKPDEEYGVRDFKAKFGGRLVNYGRNTFIHAPTRLWFSERGYCLLRKYI